MQKRFTYYRRRMVALVLAVVAMLLGMLALWILVTERSAWWGAIAAHVASAGIGAEGLRLSSKRNEDPKFTQCLGWAGWILGLGIPLLGSITVFALMIRARTIVVATPNESQESQRESAAKATYEKRRSEQQVDDGIEAAVDALEDDDLNVRIAAIESIRHHPSPAGVRLLQDARENDAFEIRVRAVETLEKFKTMYSDRIAKQRREIDNGGGTIEANQALASLLLEYVDLGIETPDFSQSLLQDAHRHAVAGIDLKHGPTGSMIFAEVLLRAGEYTQAAEAFRECLDTFGFSNEAYYGLVRAYFHNKDFEELSNAAQLGSQYGVFDDPQLRDMLRLWIPVENMV